MDRKGEKGLMYGSGIANLQNVSRAHHYMTYNSWNFTQNFKRVFLENPFLNTVDMISKFLMNLFTWNLEWTFSMKPSIARTRFISKFCFLLF